MLCGRCGRQLVGGIQLAQLTLDVALELVAVLALEVAKLLDSVLEVDALLVERRELGALARFRLGYDASRGSVSLCNESVRLSTPSRTCSS